MKIVIIFLTTVLAFGSQAFAQSKSLRGADAEELFLSLQKMGASAIAEKNGSAILEVSNVRLLTIAEEGSEGVSVKVSFTQNERQISEVDYGAYSVGLTLSYVYSGLMDRSGNKLNFNTVICKRSGADPLAKRSTMNASLGQLMASEALYSCVVSK